ncbi:MAG TPA: helix-turn-helix transcriptional regulator [Pseudobacteroides sp.]|uniref:helix-turn-helix domain-containing protein n=1 Tax=Pseudobacteroides sp. TaxID=1968840 RepID=UPI002F94D53D
MGDFEKEMRKALIDKELTIKDLSKQLGISQAYLYDILKGNRPGAKHKEKIIQVLGLNVTIN